jgi:hypothetical protein
MWKVIRYQVLGSYNFLPPDLYSTPKIVQQSTLYFEYGVLVGCLSNTRIKILLQSFTTASPDFSGSPYKQQQKQTQQHITVVKL